MFMWQSMLCLNVIFYFWWSWLFQKLDLCVTYVTRLMIQIILYDNKKIYMIW